MKPDASIEQRFTQTWQSLPGLSGWLAEVNNRPLGKRYMITSLSFFAVAAFFAMLIRAQLAVPNNNLLGPDTYNSIFTMHGSTMLYLFAVPFVEGLGLYLIPLMIGARDVAFPRLTSFGYWMYLFGGLTMFASFLYGEVPDVGWTAYTPLSGPRYSGTGLDFWLLGLSMVEIAGITAAIEIVVTILKFRAPGMALQHVPLVVWSYLVTGFMIIFAFTPLLLATLLLELDRAFGFQLFNPELGGSSLLWQHLFWWFGHPEVYIIFLPATGIISAILPAFARRRIAAYPLILAALLIIGFVSFGLWTHHMFTAGLPELMMLFFAAASFMIALASGVQIFAWIATLWGSRPAFSVPMLYILAFFFIFINGGMTGVMVATMPFDWQVHDTAFVPAHFHHVLIGGAVLPFIAALHYWLPKITGRLPGLLWDRIGLGIIFIGFNFTFIPMYIIGLFGMRRRIYTYPEEIGVGTLNLISSIGAPVLVLGFAVALSSLLWHGWRGRAAGTDPWRSGTLEWSLASPPEPYGFRRFPVVRDLYPHWQQTGSGPAAELPKDSYTARLQEIATMLEGRPAGWRATLLTDGTNARPQAVQSLSSPTLLPFYLAVSILLAFTSFLAQSYLTAGAVAVFALILVGKWLIREPVYDQEEFRALESRLGLALESSGRRATGWWGMVGFLAVMFTVLGALIYSYFYLRLYSEQWPQAGLALPQLSGSLISYGFLAAAGVALGFASWAWRRDRRTGLNFGLTVTILLGLGFVGGELISLLIEPYGHGTNAYASIFFILNGFMLLLALTGISLLMGTLVRLAGEEPLTRPNLVLWLQNSEMLWYFTVAAGLAVFLTTYLAPHLK
jgi:cytochrome c oxidase subunit I+III